MSELQRLASVWWDLHKYAMGHRPRDIDTTGWTEDDFNREIEMLSAIEPDWLTEDEPAVNERRAAKKEARLAKRVVREERAEMLGFIRR